MEFFGLDGEKERASLVWRRQYPKRYSVDTLREISKDEYDRLDAAAKARISRVPLSAGDIKTLVDTAINLHTRDLEARKQARWYQPILFQAVMGIIGAVIGGLFSMNFKGSTPTRNLPSAQVQAIQQKNTPVQK